MLHVNGNQGITRENTLTPYSSKKSVDTLKRLGIIIDKSLTLDKQIDAVCLNLTRRLTLLKLLSTYVDQTSLE